MNKCFKLLLRKCIFLIKLILSFAYVYPKIFLSHTLSLVFPKFIVRYFVNRAPGLDLGTADLDYKTTGNIVSLSCTIAEISRTTSTVYLTAYILENSFRFNMTVEITSHLCVYISSNLGTVTHVDHPNPYRQLNSTLSPMKNLPPPLRCSFWSNRFYHLLLL